MATWRGIGFHVGRIAQAAIVVGVLVAANLVGQRWFARADLTERREFTLAPATRATLAKLDDVVNVVAYFSRRVPPDVANVRSRVQDLLEEYRALARGRVHLEFVDPGDDPVQLQRTRALGIPQLQLQVLERDRFQITSVTMGLAILYGGKKEVIPVVQDADALEYELTAALLRLTSPTQQSVGWMGGETAGIGRPREEDPVRAELGRLYRLEVLPEHGLDKVPDGVATLVVDGPRKLDERTRFALDQFLMRGGRAVFLVDHFTLAEGSLAPVPLESGVHDLLEAWGVKVRKDVVAEPERNVLAGFSSGFVQFQIPYPYWVRVGREGLDRENPVTAKTETLVLPWPSSLEVALPAAGALKAEVLAKSSPGAWAESGPYDFSPQPRKARAAPREPAGERPLAVLVRGRFRSFFADKAPPAAAPGKPAPAVLRESPETSILVVGTSRLAEREFLRQFPEDGAFLLNAVDWMTMGPDLIGIRSRAASERVLREVPPGVRAFLKSVNSVAFPLLVALFGLVRLSLRRRRSRAA